MHPSQSLNTMSGHVDLKELSTRKKLYAAQRASQPLTFYQKDGGAPLRAWALSEASNGWWDIIVDNATVEDGTPHRIFETRSRMVGPLDADVRGLFSVAAPRITEATTAQPEQAVTTDCAERYRELQQAGVPGPRVSRCDVNPVGADMGSGHLGGALHRTESYPEYAQRLASEKQLLDAMALGQMTRAIEEERAKRIPLSAPGQQTGAPGRLFQRSDILAIIRGQHGIATNFHAREALDALARIIANLED